MEFQIGYFAERFIAVFALMWSLASMNKHMVPQITLLVEAFSAKMADEFFALTVRLHVRLERGRTIESFFTELALVRFFSGMNYFVPTQGTRKTEAFSTHGAHERTGLGMIRHTLVNGQGVFGFEDFPALVALVFWFE